MQMTECHRDKADSAVIFSHSLKIKKHLNFTSPPLLNKPEWFGAAVSDKVKERSGKSQKMKHLHSAAQIKTCTWPHSLVGRCYSSLHSAVGACVRVQLTFRFTCLNKSRMRNAHYSLKLKNVFIFILKFIVF